MSDENGSLAGGLNQLVASVLGIPSDEVVNGRT